MISKRKIRPYIIAFYEGESEKCYLPNYAKGDAATIGRIFALHETGADNAERLFQQLLADQNLAGLSETSLHERLLQGDLTFSTFYTAIRFLQDCQAQV